MSKLTYVVKTMSSLEIAKLCNKEHRNVMADIRNMLKDLNLSTAEFSAVYKAENGQELPRMADFTLLGEAVARVQGNLV